MLEYARKDTHYLLYLTKVLIKELRHFCSEQDGLDFQGMLCEIYDECKSLCLMTYRKPETFGPFYQRIMAGQEKNFTETQKKLLTILWVL
jgi:hypothetical protein